MLAGVGMAAFSGWCHGCKYNDTEKCSKDESIKLRPDDAPCMIFQRGGWPAVKKAGLEDK